ncbi:MAG: hypothetical protein KJ720_17275 [Proteobacteria bacterium]|nr:hypothetical protein [Pseudomonadota bacterium]MBU1449566.1 hypothetical protein [Pseudomonadota bacterium]MBU2470575.1 hypothetical protein [Pseudomonadota bacterium]MBU2516863.1 hypothetical protein [Pseudomonadota bacterium]
MPKKMVFFLILLAMVAGFIGGTFSSQLVLAKAKVHKVLKAQEFHITDQQGVTRASIYLTSKGDLYVALYDAKGKAIDSMVVTPKLIAASKKTAATVQKLERMFSGILPGK